MSDLREPVYLEEKLTEIQDSGRLSHRSSSLPTWCPGCGYFSITEGVASAFTRLDWNVSAWLIHDRHRLQLTPSTHQVSVESGANSQAALLADTAWCREEPSQ